MFNLYDVLKGGLNYHKFEVDDLLFVEYNCPLQVQTAAVWTHCDLLVHILSGTKTWKSVDGEWAGTAGSTLYIKKGAKIIDQFFEDDFCMLGFFISDNFIKESVQESNVAEIGVPRPEVYTESAQWIENTIPLQAFFQSMLSYFHHKGEVADSLLKLKLKELIINLLSDSKNEDIASYFHRVSNSTNVDLKGIMEKNFLYNLSLEEYAEMSHRSLSTFKRDFKKSFDSTPGRWLLEKRLQHAKALIHRHGLSISDIIFESGFEDLSHFSRSFKAKFGQSPTQYRNQLPQLA